MYVIVPFGGFLTPEHASSAVCPVSLIKSTLVARAVKLAVISMLIFGT